MYATGCLAGRGGVAVASGTGCGGASPVTGSVGSGRRLRGLLLAILPLSSLLTGLG